MKFQLAINLERMHDRIDMVEVERHTLEMVKMADQGGFSLVWAAEHHALEMTIAPESISNFDLVGGTYRTYPAGDSGCRRAVLASHQSGRRSRIHRSDQWRPA